MSTDAPMDAGTLKALRGSIIKWERIVAGTGFDLGPSNCPLCKKFYEFGSPTSCIGCPVMESTGKRYCEGSPYVRYDEKVDKDCNLLSEEALLDAARNELDFLKSLLPKEVQS